ncbi:MAG: radical SAM protein [Chloroflexi bacterium]|nr:radical SAM protein [Chloroflexota bacterium]
MSDLQLPLITAPLRTMIPIIKVVGDACNLRCPYCFYSHLDQSTIKVMPPELQEKFISEFMALFSGYITFNWHGGEPLLAGLPFFQRAMELQAANMRDGRAPRNTIQTNGTLIDHAWAEFLRNTSLALA